MVLGIDLGTSSTVAASLSRDGSAVIIPDSNNKELLSTPSLVLLDNNKAYVGTFAENLFELYPNKQLLSFFKRAFGSGKPFHVDDHNNAWFSEGLAALVLKKVRYDAELYLPDGFNQTVITVPAHYNDIQRKSVFEAARLADLELSAILDEPVAAALFYGSGNKTKEEELTLVYDFGGGTFDLTLITQNEDHLHVVAKEGLSKLGGKEFDEIIAGKIRSAYEAAYKTKFPTDPLSNNRLQKMAEQLKIELSNTSNPVISQWLLFGKNAMEFRFLTQAYQAAAFDLIEKTNESVNRCLRSMGLQLEDIKKIILIGGTSSGKIVYDYWNLKTKDADTKVIYHQPLNSVAKGAALYAASIQKNNPAVDGIYSSIDLKSVSTYNIGLIPVYGDNKIDLLIHRNTPLPAVAKRLYKINPSTAAQFMMDVCQYWDESMPEILGTVQLDMKSFTEEFILELNIENKANGTIGLKLRNADNGREVRFTFIRKKSDYQYNYQSQRNLVDSVYLNNCIW